MSRASGGSFRLGGWLFRPCLGLLLAMALLPKAQAHRLDEYLQATFIAVAPAEVRLELCLTPGMDLATNLLGRLDTDHDGSISPTEGAAYAEQVRQDLSLTTDRVPRELALTGTSFPPVAELRAGLGIIRLNLRAPMDAGGAGAHQLAFTNRHLTNFSVYLVNALVPESAAITVTGQTRDELQSAIWLDYTVAVDTAAGLKALPNIPPAIQTARSPLPILLAAGMAAFVAVALQIRRRRQGRSG
jgi:hypothetical protein